MIEQLFKPNKEKLNIKDVEITTSNKYQDAVKKQEIERQIEPQIYYYNSEIKSSDVVNFNIDSSGQLPTCNLTFNDSTNMMTDLGFPADNATITFVLPSGHKNLTNIFLTFKIINYDVVNPVSKVKRIVLDGILNIDTLLIKEYKSYKGTSFKTLQEIAKNSGCGFMSNISSTKDDMTRLNPGTRNINFIKEMVSKSYINDNAFLTTFVDFYYNINYIDIEKALGQDISEINWVNINRMSKDGEVSFSKPLLTNNKATMNDAVYFTGENIVNKSTDISLQRGYTRNVHFYDFDGNWNKKAGSYKVYGLDSISTSQNGDNKIVLKGDGASDFYKKNANYIYTGILDTTNTYPDYLYAKIQNNENKYDLTKISIQITLPNPNFNIRRLEKVKLSYVNNNVGASGKFGSATLNGEWLVTKISFHKNGKSPLYQKVTLVKRELEVG